MKEITALLQSTDGLLSQADDNLKKLEAIVVGAKIKAKMQPVMAKFEEVNKRLLGKKKDLLSALMSIAPADTTISYGAYGIHLFHISPTRIIMEGAFGKEGYSVDEFVGQPHFEGHFYFLCDRIASRVETFLAESVTDQVSQIEKISSIITRLEEIASAAKIPQS